LAAIPLVYALGNRLFNPSVALTVSALVAWLPAIIRYDTAARGYSMVSFFSLLAWFLAWQALEKGRWRSWLGVSVSISLGAFAIPTMALPAGGLYLWILGEILLRGERQMTVYFRWLVSGLLTGLLTLLLYTPVLLVSGWRKLFANGFVEPVERESYFSKVLWRQLGDTWDLWNLDTPLAISLLLGLGMVLSLIFSRKIASTRLHLAVPMLLWITFYIILRRPNAFDRFWSFLLAPSMLWAAAGWLGLVAHLPAISSRLQKWIGPLAISILALAMIVSVPTFPARWAKMSNSEAIAIELVPDLRSGDMVLIGYPNDTPTWYYLHRYGADDSVWQARETFERAFIITSTHYQQTPAQVIQQNELGLELFDLENVIRLGQIGFLEIYLVSTP
jgi:hypothetical protein